MPEKITVRNTLNGEVSVEDVWFLENPTFAQFYVEVEEGAKPYDPNFYQPKTAEEFRAQKPGAFVAPVDEPEGLDSEDELLPIEAVTTESITIPDSGTTVKDGK